jgi:MFS family permease
VLFLGTVNSVNQTARYSLINNLVPRDDLMNAIALNSSVSNLAKILGPSLGGVLISIIGIAGCLFVNAVSFLAIIGTLVIMKFPSLSSKPGKRHRSGKKSLKVTVSCAANGGSFRLFC